MKRIAVLIGASLIMIFVFGMNADAYAQNQCCPDGYMSELSYRWESNSCVQVDTCDRNGDECALSCNFWDGMVCINAGYIWYDAPACYCDTAQCNPSLAQSCVFTGRYWDSSTCTCGECNPYWASCGNWVMNPYTCECEQPPDPCENPYPIMIDALVIYPSMCVDCNVAYVPAGYRPVTIEYIGSDYRTCYAYNDYVYFDEEWRWTPACASYCACF